MPKHFFFDLDKTLTVSRTPMDPGHQEIFDRLCSVADVVVVTGGSVEQIRDQVTLRFDGKYYVLAASGNHALGKDGTLLWREIVDKSQTRAVYDFVEILKRYFNETVKDENDLVEHRGAQISYSVIGFHENVDRKYAFDPDDARRAAALAAYPEAVRMLATAGIEVTPAGTTTYNFLLAGKHKGYNVARFIERERWEKKDCIYVGDALFPGGNDETVIGIIPTHAVTSPDDTFNYLSSILV
ncbi:MAG: HAD-IIB family hydrolase [Minisyncoccia bacterium]